MHMANIPSENKGCLTALLDLLRVISPEVGVDESLPYRIRDDFLSPAESSFYNVLSMAIAGQATICPKVNLIDVFFVARPNMNQSYRNRIDRKHLDFLVCKPKTMQPILGIELDDTSHNRPKGKQRDNFVDRVFQTAGLPLLHVPVKPSYSTSELSAKLAHYLNQPLEAKGSTGSTSTVAPLCPKCGTPMVVRTSTRGERQGTQSYGCRNYPHCHEMLAIE
jgi:uncharacterized protein DUF2726/topoisomerase-like DNA binding C4 zinc finger protein